MGHQEWKKQTTLTQEFERCTEQEPFKRSSQTNNPQTILEAKDLQKYFDEFNQIFDATGLPPIWNGQKLLPWKQYHQESIQVVQGCHEKLGVTRPQHELHGSYSKPVWDPNSKIWQPEQSPT
ncbi:hypothetical protein [Synechococcus sp. UW179A]|uniref:hypothetical protein n=1 Tax=Synechococcus sp. UW179A TaxID=2575510 RepID=UPI0010BEF0D0|nr:hypothetical protein [Synechococcus sp. UW179A]